MIKLNFSVRKQYYIWCGSIAILILTLIAPAGNGAIRLMTVLSAIGIWLGIPWLWRSRKVILAIWTIVTMLVTIFLLSPGSIVAADVLRSDYIDSLKTYHNTKYIWGGENHWGIDCSGLVRQGFIRANLSRGLKTVNAAPIRKGLLMWWFDASAVALKDGYQQWTKPLFAANSINEIDLKQLLPGDLAVTADGVHVLAYLGDGRWIEADPGIRKVIIVNVPEPNNGWFQMPVKIVRWQELSTIASDNGTTPN
jgi:hypothetical protein